MPGRQIAIWFAVVCAGMFAVARSLAAQTPQDESFFRERVEPILKRRCYACHSHDARPLEGGLTLDSRAGWERGGDSGPAIIPGKPDESRLIRAVRRASPDLAMPPETPLPVDEVATLVDWVGRGAPDPRKLEPKTAGAWSQTFAERRQWWAFQPPKKPELPNVSDPAAARDPLDRFVLARLESTKLPFAEAAQPLDLARRLSFVLKGLPPPEEDLLEFSATIDRAAPDALERLVDRWLASPRFGEHWARHWMDLVRYSDTHGSEHDPLIPFAWRYRDYLIRAFNRDVAYDRLMSEHVAGDLLEPRVDAETQCNESLLGTTVARFVEFYPTPVDVKAEEISILDTQVDTLTKTFLGLTLSCARCHDHKFDPLSADDYHAFYGILASTRATIRHVDSPARRQEIASQLTPLKQEIRGELADLWLAQLERWPALLRDLDRKLATAAAPTEEPTLALWRKALEAARDKPQDPLHSVAIRAAGKPAPPAPFPPGADPLADPRFYVFADWRKADDSKAAMWFTSDGFPSASAPGEFFLTTSGKPVVGGVYPRGRFTHLLTNKQGGSLRSTNFTLDMKYVSVLAAGYQAGRVRLVIENFQSDQLLFAQAMPPLNDSSLRWITLPVREAWRGRRAYLDVHPRDEMPYPGKHPDARKMLTDGRSGVGIRAVVFHDALPAPPFDSPWSSTVADVKEWNDVATALVNEVRTTLLAWREDRSSDEQALRLDSLVRSGLLDSEPAAGGKLESLVNRYRQLESEYPAPVRAAGVVEDVGFDERLFPRGNYRRATASVARRVPEALGKVAATNDPAFPFDTLREEDRVWNRTRGSGRRALVEHLAQRRHPLTARVAVNRLWQHTFGTGIVRTVDNFGRLGETPSHPELLDQLAIDFADGGWSMKNQIRRFVTSATFRRSTHESDEARRLDPDNRLMSHASVRRLEAESIRDNLLAASGRLDLKMGGFGVPLPVRVAYKDFEMPLSGPDDGHGRRSVYLEARRNYPQPLLAAFDQPKPVLTVGQRNITNVPAQSLALWNDPFVLDQAKQLAERSARESSALADGTMRPDSGTPDPRERRMRRLVAFAFSRPASGEEVSRGLAYLDEVRQTLNVSADDPRAWTELAHALMTALEFVYLP